MVRGKYKSFFFLKFLDCTGLWENIIFLGFWRIEGWEQVFFFFWRVVGWITTLFLFGRLGVVYMSIFFEGWGCTACFHEPSKKQNKKDFSPPPNPPKRIFKKTSTCKHPSTLSKQKKALYPLPTIQEPGGKKNNGRDTHPQPSKTPKKNWGGGGLPLLSPSKNPKEFNLPSHPTPLFQIIKRSTLGQLLNLTPCFKFWLLVCVTLLITYETRDRKANRGLTLWITHCICNNIKTYNTQLLFTRTGLLLHCFLWKVFACEYLFFLCFF